MLQGDQVRGVLQQHRATQQVGEGLPVHPPALTPPLGRSDGWMLGRAGCYDGLFGKGGGAMRFGAGGWYMYL
jgi:hypothetical protein